MGYSCTITSNKDITESEIQEIVDKIPNKLKGYILEGSKVRQSWGWSLYSDVKIPIENELKMSGSYSISGSNLDEFINYFVDSLKSNGHEISYDLS